MPHHLPLLEILAIGFLLALVLGFITHRLRLSPIVGYLLAGFLVGPHSPGFVADADLAHQLAEVGVILLMFGVGLHFDLKDLLAVKGIALPGAIAQSFVATLLGVAVAMGAGLPLSAGIMLGLGMSVASTVVLMRVLMDNDMLDTVHGHVAVGWLIVEDIFTVLVLVMLPAIAAIMASSTADGSSTLAVSLLWALGKLVLLGILILPVGGRVIPWVLAHVARTRSRELFTLAILVLAIAIATGSAMIFGASVALGAFLAGMVVGKSKVSHQAAADLLPMRDAFAVLFFLSVGMLFNPAFIIERPGLVLAALGVILLAKPLIALVVVIVLGYSVRTGLTVALALAQIGEFSFILAQQAQSLDLLDADGYSLLVACALITITINPLLFRTMIPIENWLRSKPALWRWLNGRAERKGLEANHTTHARLTSEGAVPRAIVVGYGPVGQRVATILREFQIQPTIIDLNVDTVTGLVGEGHAAVYGDASQPAILEEAGISSASYLLITLPDLTQAIAAVTSARHLNPALQIMVRVRYLNAQSMLEGLGVTAVAVEEEEVAQAMTELLIKEVREHAV